MGDLLLIGRQFPPSFQYFSFQLLGSLLQVDFENDLVICLDLLFRLQVRHF